jgi:hypothetical protein
MAFGMPRIDAGEPIHAAGVNRRALRHTLDVQAFGLNAYTAPAAGDGDLDTVRDRPEFPA